MDVREIREVASRALARIEATPKNAVRASRRGIVGGAQFTGATHLFRRVGGDGYVGDSKPRVRFEIWHNTASGHHVTTHELPADLEREAGRMLDEL